MHYAGGNGGKRIKRKDIEEMAVSSVSDRLQKEDVNFILAQNCKWRSQRTIRTFFDIFRGVEMFCWELMEILEQGIS